MAPSNTDTGAEVVRPVTRESALAAYPEMVMAIPMADDGDGSGIIADILMATNWEQLNGQTSLPAGKDLIGRQLKVTGLTRHESDQADGLGWYLVIDSEDISTHEAIKWQTSAGALMATLVKLYSLGVLPAVIEVNAAQTRGGRTAVGCKVLAVGGSGR